MPAGTNQILIVWVVTTHNNPTISATYNGSAMTSIVTPVDSGNTTKLAAFYLINPPAGTADIVVNRSDSGNAHIVASVYSGVNQTTPLGNTATGTNGGSTPFTVSVSHTRSASTSTVVMGSAAGWNSSYTANTPNVGTQRHHALTGGEARSFAQSDYSPGSTGTTSMTHTRDSANWSGGGAIAFELLDGSAATNTPTFTHTPTATPVGTVVAPCVTGITVNGTIDEAAWSTVGWTEIAQCWQATCSTTAYFKTAYDSTYLYIALDVNDNALHDGSAADWQDDSVEIYFGHKALSATYDGNDWQFVLPYDNTSLSSGSGSPSLVGVLTGATTKSGGYYQEWAIPWSNLSVTPAAGGNYGFDVGVNFDTDGGDSREYQRGWYGNNTAWSNPQQFGTVILGSACATPTITPTFSATPSRTSTATPTPCVSYNGDYAVGTSNTSNGFTVSACSNQILIATIIREAADAPSAVYYAGVTMTAVANLARSSSNLQTYVYYLVNPTAGTNNLTLAGIASPMRIHMFTYCGVDTSSPIGNTNYSTGTGGGPTFTRSTGLTPSSSLSTIVQMFALQTCSQNTTQTVDYGSNRAANGGSINNQQSFGLADYFPGSTSAYTLNHGLAGGGACGSSGQVGMLLELKAQCAVGTATITPTLTTTPLCAVSDALNNSSLAPYWTGADIGGPIAGSQSEGSSLLVNAGGADIWGTSDQFRYVYQSHCGDFDVRVRVNYGPATNSWAKSGIMLRDGTAANASFAMIAATLDNNYQFAYRNGAGTNAVDGGTGGSYQNGTGGYLRLTRVGNGYSAYYSADGSTWTQLGTTQTFTMTSCAVLGLAVTSHDNGNLGQASFNNFAMASGSCAAATATPTPTRSPTPNNTPTPESCGTAPGFCGDSMVVNGSASAISAGSEYQITNGGTWIRGSVWSPNYLNLSSNFDYSFDMNFGNADGGADGMAFVIQDAGTGAIGSNGGNLGYGGLPTFSGGTGVSITPSIAVEFDTFRNLDQAGAEPDTNDPNYDHMMVLENGNMYHSGCPSTVTTADGNCPTGALVGNGNIETNTWYTVRVTWNAASKQMQVYFNGVLRITYNRDLIRDIFNGSNCVYAGFTAASGGATNDQRVRFCLPTPTATPTRTNSQSPTRTNSRSPSPTHTRTITRTFTASPVVSPTNTPIASPTMSPTPMAVPMTKSINVGSAVIGQTITYCITWQNNSGGAAAISIWDTVPIVMAYMSCWAQSGALTSCNYSPRLATFNIGAAVANGASGQVCFSAVVTGYPWLPGFDAVAWLGAIARDEDIDPWRYAMTGAHP